MRRKGPQGSGFAHWALPLVVAAGGCTPAGVSRIGNLDDPSSTAGSLTTVAVIQHQAEHMAAVSAVLDVFRVHDLLVYLPKDDDPKARSLSTQSILEGAECKNGHLVLVPAVSDGLGNYLQPVTTSEEGYLVRKNVVVAALDDHEIRLTQSVASSESPHRVQVPVDPRIVRDLTDALPGGAVQAAPLAVAAP